MSFLFLFGMSRSKFLIVIVSSSLPRALPSLSLLTCKTNVYVKVLHSLEVRLAVMFNFKMEELVKGRKTAVGNIPLCQKQIRFPAHERL